MIYIESYSERISRLCTLLDEADHIIVGAGSGLSSAAGLDYAGGDFRREFHEWIKRYGFTDLYSSSFYPFKSEEERWACWAKHIWFAHYRLDALPLYRQLMLLIKDKDYFIITTNVDSQFEKAGFDKNRIFATQGDYGLFQPASGYPEETYNNKEWVEKVLPLIRECRIPTEYIPYTPDGQPVAMNLRCDNTFVEDTHWHEQAERYRNFVKKASNSKLLLLEMGVGFNTPVIIRYPFEQMTALLPDATLVRFNRDYQQLITNEVKRFIPFTEDINTIVSEIMDKKNDHLT